MEKGRRIKKREPNAIPLPADFNTPIKIMKNDGHYEKTSSTKTYLTERCGHVTENSNKINESVKRLFYNVPQCMLACKYMNM